MTLASFIGVPMHLVDTTLFYSPTSGGVRRYLNAKHSWLDNNSSWRHSLVVPGPGTRFAPGSFCTIRGALLPGTFNYRLPLNLREWSRMLEALEPDLLEVGDAFHPAWCAAGVARRRHVPVVAFHHSHLPALIGLRTGHLMGRAAERYLRLVYGRMDLVLAPSMLMCNRLRDLGVRNVVLQPLGVDADTFNPRHRSHELRARLGIPPRTRLLAYAGRFSGEKNIGQLEEALKVLGDGYHLLMIGGGEARRIAANITRLPYRRDNEALARLLASVDAFVHAGTAETFGLAVVEAMACGRPVVGVRSGAVPELVDERVGCLARDAKPLSLAMAVRDLFDRDLEFLGRAAREKVVDRYTWTRVLQLQLQLYASLCGVGTTSGAVVHVPAAAAIQEIGIAAP